MSARICDLLRDTFDAGRLQLSPVLNLQEVDILPKIADETGYAMEQPGQLSEPNAPNQSHVGHDGIDWLAETPNATVQGIIATDSLDV